jgi:hypothetical protein
MAYVDNNLVLSDAQAVTATASSTKSIDFATATRNIGSGEKLELIVTITTTVAASGGASTTTFSLDDSADNSTFAVVVQTIAIAKATLVAGYEALRVHLPATLRRYIQVTYTVATNDWTAGAVSAYLTVDRQDNVARPSGFTVG